MRVLLIEDDSATAQSIELMLQSESFKVYTTDLGEEGVDLGKLYDYDLILLDINLPDMSGYEVLKTLRVSKVSTPILILSGLAGIEDKVRGLGVGADDYMTKPFSIRELLARCAAFLRRRRRAAPERFAFGTCILDLQSHRLLRDDREVALSPKEFRLLELFARHAGRALTRDQILRRVWGTDVLVTTRSVDRCVTTLRGKIEADPRRPRFIHTIRDVGYRFEPEQPATP